MATLTEAQHPGEFIVSEANGTLSRETVTITGGDYAPGTVLGLLTSGGNAGSWTQLTVGASDGSQTASAVLFGHVDASEADQSGVIVRRLAEVRDVELIWPDGITTNQKNTAIGQLALAHIVVR